MTAAARQLPERRGEMGADQRTELDGGGGEKRVCRDQDRYQDPQQDQCPGRAQSRGQKPPRVLPPAGGKQRGKGRAQTSKQPQKKKQQPLPKHGGPLPGYAGSGKGQRVKGQQHQQDEKIPQAEKGVGGKGEGDSQKKAAPQQDPAFRAVKNSRAQCRPQQHVPAKYHGGDAHAVRPAP